MLSDAGLDLFVDALDLAKDGAAGSLARLLLLLDLVQFGDEFLALLCCGRVLVVWSSIELGLDGFLQSLLIGELVACVTERLERCHSRRWGAAIYLALNSSLQLLLGLSEFLLVRCLVGSLGLLELLVDGSRCASVGRGLGCDVGHCELHYLAENKFARWIECKTGRVLGVG